MLLIMVAIHFVMMFGLMYSMVNTAGDIHPHLNQVYMAASMTAPMALLELWLMRSMYRDRQLNMLVIATGVVVLVLSLAAIRQQSGIGDRQFLKSMIPHHSGAILMCREARIADAEIRELCQSIMEGQQREIDQMRAILQRMD